MITDISNAGQGDDASRRLHLNGLPRRGTRRIAQGNGGSWKWLYHPEPDLFSVRFESVLVSLETIFAAVFAAGKKMGQEYLPEIVPISA